MGPPRASLPLSETRAVSPEARILEAATKFVQSQGARRLTVVAVAESIHMSHANVYRYFPSKAALIEAVTAAWLRPIEQEARGIADSPDPAPDKLERMILGLHRAYRVKLERDQNLFRLFTEATENAHALARRHRAIIQSAIQRTLEEGFTQNAFRPMEIRPALALVFDVGFRFLHPIGLWADRDQARQAVDARAGRAARLLLYALSTGRY